MPMTDTLTFCASDMPVTFRPACNLNPNPSPGPVTLACSVWLIGPPVDVPDQREMHRSFRMLFKFVMGEDPSRRFDRKLSTGDQVEWGDLVLSVLGTVLPTKVSLGPGSGTRDVWMLFADMII
jgi:hypothetical protein